MKKLITFSLLTFILASCSSHQKHHDKGHAHHHRFDDAEKWAKVFEDEKRVAWQKPDEVFKAVGIKKTSLVADIGSATGFFPVRIAKVASKGRVWGVDVEPNLVNFLNRRAKKEKISNMYSILGTFTDPLLPEAVDFIFIVNTYHHISDRKIYFENLKGSLRKDGKIVIIDFRKGDLPFGPKDPMKISRDEIIKEMKEAKYILHSEHKFLPYQNLLIFSSK